MQDLKTLCRTYRKCALNAGNNSQTPGVGVTAPEHHGWMRPQGASTLGLSGVADSTPVTPENFLFELGFTFLQTEMGRLKFLENQF